MGVCDVQCGYKGSSRVSTSEISNIVMGQQDLAALSSLEAYVNGEFVASHEAVISVHDRGFTRGEGVFDTLRTYGGKLVPSIVERHMNRLAASVRYLEMDPGPILGEVTDAIELLVARNQHAITALDDVWVAPYVTRSADDGVNLVIVLRPFPDYTSFHVDGVRLVGSVAGHGIFGAVDPRVKSISRLGYARAERRAHRISWGTFGVLFTGDGYIAEATGANLLVILDGKVVQPAVWDALAGISASIFTESAESLGYPSERRNISMYDLLNADGAYLTATSFGMARVTSVDGIAINIDNTVGPKVRKLWVDKVGYNFFRDARE